MCQGKVDGRLGLLFFEALEITHIKITTLRLENWKAPVREPTSVVIFILA